MHPHALVETLHLAPHQKPLFFLPITLHTLTLFFLGIGFFIKYHLILLYKSNTPALATITKIKTKDCQIEKYLDFSIAQSRSGEVATRVLPDASIIINKGSKPYTLHRTRNHYFFCQ
jgi:hypothetical protein